MIMSAYFFQKKLFEIIAFRVILILFIDSKFIKGDTVILIKIPESGYNQVLSQDFQNQIPDIIKIANEDQSLKEGNFYDFEYPNNDIQLIWDGNLETFENMFKGCSNITEFSLISFEGSFINNTSNMFSGCISLTSVDFSIFDTSSVTDMSNMFSGCSSLKSLNLSSFNTSSLEKMDYIFKGCSSLNSLDLSNWNLSKIISITQIFSECYNLDYLNFRKASINNDIFFQIIKNIFAESTVCYDEIEKKQTLNCSTYYNNKRKTVIFSKSSIIKNSDFIKDNNCNIKCPNEDYFFQRKIIFDIKTSQTTEYDCIIRYKKNILYILKKMKKKLVYQKI